MNVRPEKVGDVDEGETSDLEVGGLTAEERAQFDAMANGRDIPGEAGDGDGGEGADGADGDGSGEVEAGAADGAGDRDPADGDVAAADAAGDKDQIGADGKKVVPKTISYHKHQRELAKLNKAAADMQARLDGATAETTKEREARTRLDERTKMLLEAINAAKAAPAAAAAPAEPEDPEPDADDDPIAHSQWQGRELKRTQKIIQDIRNESTQTKTATAAEREQQQLYQDYEADLVREAGSDATFSDAFVHLRETRYRELGFIYADIDIQDPAQCALLSAQDQITLSNNIKASFHNEQMLVAQEARRAGKSPAKVVANLARARGFVPKAAEATPPAGGKPATNGAAAPRGAPPAGAAPRSVAEDLQAIRANQEAARSLSDAGGSPGGTITPERLAEMSDDEFMELYESMPKSKLDKIMGKTPL